MTIRQDKKLESTLKKFCDMRYPSVEAILRRRGFGVEADACKALVKAYDASGRPIPVSLQKTAANFEKEYFLIILGQDREAYQEGPFISDDKRIVEAVKHRREDPEKKDIILWLDVYPDGDIEVGSFGESVFQNEDVETE